MEGAIENNTEGSSENTPKGVLRDLYVEYEIKGALEVTIELHLKMNMLVH